MISATRAGLRRLTLYTAKRLAAPAERDRMSGGIVASATPAGQRRRNHSVAHATAPMAASTAKADSRDPGTHPAPCAPALVISNSRPPAAHSTTQATSAAISRLVRRSRTAIGTGESQRRDRDTPDRLARGPKKGDGRRGPAPRPPPTRPGQGTVRPVGRPARR